MVESFGEVYEGRWGENTKGGGGGELKTYADISSIKDYSFISR
jgi:hypothetical protein